MTAAEYRVRMKMVWYKANGTQLMGTSTGRLQWYNAYEELDTLDDVGLVLGLRRLNQFTS